MSMKKFFDIYDILYFVEKVWKKAIQWQSFENSDWNYTYLYKYKNDYTE